jgi:uncharacterized protein (TIGR02246 family)
MSVSDIVEIEQLLYRYCFAVDGGEAETVAGLFAEDAVLVPVYTGEAPVEGRAAILGWYQRYGQAVNARSNHLRHVVSTPVIDVDGDRASAQCYLTANSVSKTSGMASWTAGAYRDELVRRDGRWLFKRREIYVHYATEHQPRG